MVPVVRNMYQSLRHILWGFTHSLISKELLTHYTWSGRSEDKSKRPFVNLKYIQGVLWCAMVKVSPTYSVQQFEEDFRTILVKIASRSKAHENFEEKDVFDEKNIDENGNNSLPNEEIIEKGHGVKNEEIETV